jgi:two-component system, OmpR family, KDP operon response regulator KdpE
MTVGESPRVALLVEDEIQIRRFVRTTLESENWQVFDAATIRDGLVEAATRKPDLVVLDLGMPDGDGIDFIHAFRGWSDGSLIVLSARTAEEAKINALDAGADDYLTKPFGVGELLARVRATLRRKGGGIAGAAPAFTFGDVRVDFTTGMVHRKDERIHLTPIEFRMLAMLVANAGRILTHRQILREVWGSNYVEHAHYVRVHMGHLRQKLEVDPAQPRHLLTETAVGYRLVA